MALHGQKNDKYEMIAKRLQLGPFSNIMKQYDGPIDMPLSKKTNAVSLN